MSEQEEDFTNDVAAPTQPAVVVTKPLDLAKVFDLNENRESTRGDLARGLLWLLTFAIGGVLAFIGLGLLDGSVLTESIFPSLVALSGTALGFYFGSQSAQAEAGKGTGVSAPPASPPGGGQSRTAAIPSVPPSKENPQKKSPGITGSEGSKP